MKTLLLGWLVWISAALIGVAKEDPLVSFYGSAGSVRGIDVVNEVPVVLMLKDELRDALFEKWEEEPTEARGCRRMKGLLLEDRGDDGAGEWLAEFPGDQLRLLWRAGKLEEAVKLWKGMSGDRREHAEMALLPMVAKGDAAEIKAFHAFLFESLSASDVVSLCGVNDLPEFVADSMEVKREWLLANPDLISGRIEELPKIERLLIALKTRRMEMKDFHELFDWVGDDAVDPEERTSILKTLAGRRHSGSESDLVDVIINAWMDAYPEEVAKLIVRGVEEGQTGLAEICGPRGMVHLRRLLKDDPTNKVAKFALLLAQENFGASIEENYRLWRECLDVTMDVPLLSGLARAADPGYSTVGQLGLEFGRDAMPLRLRKLWYGDWKSAKPRSAGDLIAMAVWLHLDDEAWEYWDEAAKDPGMRFSMLDWVDRGLLSAGRLSDQVAVRAVYEKCWDESWATDAVLGLKRKRVVHSDTRLAVPRVPTDLGLSKDVWAELVPARLILTTVLCSQSPIRDWGFGWVKPRSSWVGPVRRGDYDVPLGIRRTGKSAMRWRLWWRGVLHSVPGEAEPEKVEKLLEGLDEDRLGVQGRGILEVCKVADLFPKDKIRLRRELEEWWALTKSPDAGTLLYSLLMGLKEPQVEASGKLLDELVTVLPAKRLVSFSNEWGDEMELRMRKVFEEKIGVKEEERSVDRYLRMDDLSDEWLAKVAEAQVMLGRDENPLLGVMDAEPPRKQAVEQAVASAFETLKEMGAEEADLALGAYRCSLNHDRLEMAARLAATGRKTLTFARTYFPLYRMRQDREEMENCLSLLADRSGGLALKFLDDPAMITFLGTERVAELAELALGSGGSGIDSILGVITNLTLAGDQNGAMRVARASCALGSDHLWQVIPLLEPGAARNELAAVWLSGMSVEIHKTTNRLFWNSAFPAKLFDQEPPELDESEWKEVARLLRDERRWRTNWEERPVPLLAAMILAGERSLEGLEIGIGDKELLWMFFSAAPMVNGSPKEGKVLAKMAGEFAAGIQAGELSEALMDMLIRYPVEQAEIRAAFQIHLMANEAPLTTAILERMLSMAGVDAALELVNQRKGAVTLQEARQWARVFGQARYDKEGWGLVEPFAAEIKEQAANEIGMISEILPLARAAEREDVVEALIDAAGGPSLAGVRESQAWLEARRVGPVYPDGVQGRWRVGMEGQMQYEWLLTSKVGAAIRGDGGYLEITCMTKDHKNLSLVRENVEAVSGIVNVEKPADAEYLAASYRTGEGVILSLGSQRGEMECFSPEGAGVRSQIDGPIPGMHGELHEVSGLLGEAKVGGMVKGGVSVWVKGPKIPVEEFFLSWHDAAGRELGSQEARRYESKEGWSLLSISLPHNQPTAEVETLKLRLKRLTGRPLAIAGLLFLKTTEEKDGGEKIGRVSLEPTCLEIGRGPWLIGGKGVGGSGWVEWDPESKTAGEIVRLRSEPKWMKRVGDGVLVLGVDGDLWRFVNGAKLPVLVFAFRDSAPELAVSDDGRWLVASYRERRLAVWDLSDQGSIFSLKGADVSGFDWLQVVVEDDAAFVVTGIGNRDARWYGLPGLELVEERIELPSDWQGANTAKSAYRADGMKLWVGYQELRVTGADREEIGGLPETSERCFGWSREGHIIRVDKAGTIYASSPEVSGE